MIKGIKSAQRLKEMLNHGEFNPVRHPVLMLIISEFDSEISLNVISVLATNPLFYPIRSSILHCLSQSTAIGGSYLNFPTIAVNIVKLRRNDINRSKFFFSFVYCFFFNFLLSQQITCLHKNFSNMCIMRYLKKKKAKFKFILRDLFLLKILLCDFHSFLNLVIIKI